jgi:hypothetical protein
MTDPMLMRLLYFLIVFFGIHPMGLAADEVFQCEKLFKPAPQINVFYVSHHGDKIHLGPDTILTIQKSETSHRRFFQILADFPVPDRNLLWKMENLMAPALRLSPHRKVPLQSFEIMMEDLFLWLDSLSILKSIAAIYPESTKILISKMEVIPNSRNQKLGIVVSFHLMDSSPDPENLDSRIPELIKKIQVNIKNERSLFFWKLEPQFHLRQLILNTNYQYFSMDAQKQVTHQESLRDDSFKLLQIDVPTSYGLLPLQLLTRRTKY